MSPKQPERPEAMPWRDNVEAMTVAIIMAVMLKYFIVEAYKIPTGSMQPTLFGQAWDTNRDGRVDGGVFDRILVDKLSYHFRDPERFDVVVFKYPLDRSKNFVKRLVGMPGEQLRITRGDLWTRPDTGAEWSILRRPDKVMDDLWKRMELAADQNRPLWQAEGPAAAGWDFDGDRIRAGSEGTARFVGHGGQSSGGAIVDTYLHGYPEAIRDKVQTAKEPYVVGDLRVAGRVEPSAECARIVIAIDDGPLQHRFILPGPAAGPDERVRIESSPKTSDERLTAGQAGSELGPLRAGRKVDFDVQNLDDRLVLSVDGRVACELETSSVDLSLALTGIQLDLQGGGAELSELACYRDLYYKPSGDGTSEWDIPEGHYFMLGDNTQDSSDGREWAWYALSWDGEGSDGEPVRGNRRLAPRGMANPPHDANPVYPRGSDLTFFTDEWGERYSFPRSTERAVLGPTGTRAPFVARELITGRALLVFWPFKPWAGINRLKWVD